MPEQKTPVSGAFRLTSLMYFCSGQPIHFCSGVDNCLYEAAGLVVELEAGTANGTVARDRVVHIDERDGRTAALDWGIVL
jgi:hypothetical protein